MKYRAFISYSHKDKAWTDWLHKALESYAVPKRLVGRETDVGVVPARLIPIFRDREELASAADLSRQVNDAIAQSATLIVVCSPDAACSRWVNEEILAFKRLGRGSRIFCLIVAGEPNVSAGQAQNECFPPALRFALADDGNLSDQRVEPVAADARPNMDGKANAKLKLVAGILGVNLDELKQRELQRRNRRLSALAAMALLMMVVTSTLAFKAVMAQRAAERRQKQAEGLVDFMLGDLDVKLREVNRIDILESVATEAMAYFAALPADDVSEHALAKRADALEKIGNIRLTQGSLQPALESFQAATAINRALVAAHPEVSALQGQLASSISFSGNVFWQQRRNQEAGKAFSQARAIYVQASRRDPKSVDLLNGIARQDTNTGRLLESSGDLAGAFIKYQDVLKTFQRLAALQPAEKNWRSEIGYANNNLGKLAVARGQLRLALRYYQTDLAIKQALSRDNPSDNTARQELVTSLLFMTKSRNQIGDAEGGRKDAESALALLDQLIAFDPGRSDLPYFSALGNKSLATILLDLDHPLEATKVIEKAMQLMTNVLSAEPDNQRRRLRQIDVQLLAADIALINGQRSEAIRLTNEVQETLAALPAAKSDKQELARLQALAWMVLARADASSAGAHRSWLKAREQLAPFVINSLDPDLLDPWLQVAIVLDTKPFPDDVLQRLHTSGYRRAGFLKMLMDAGVVYE